MTIQNINNNNYPDKSVNKSDKSNASKQAGKGNHTAGAQGSDATASDSLNLSKTEFSSEVELAHSILKKQNSGNFGRLKKIKQQINQGTFDTEEVHSEIASMIENDILSLSNDIEPVTDSDGLSLTPEYREFLTENEAVREKVADKVARDLRKI